MVRPVSEVLERLEKVSDYEGVSFGRVHLIFDAEQEHSAQALQFKGYITLSDAFKCHFLEAVELFNRAIVPEIESPLSEHFALFMPRLVHNFRSVCGAERAALLGYPYQGYTVLRNVFDSAVLTSAALQRITDFYAIEGVVPSGSFDRVEAKRLRKKTEFKVRGLMTGDESGLSAETINELKIWDDMFDYETHGGRLSATHAVDWMKGQAPLPAIATYDEDAFALFMNRFCEVAWMIHKLLPMMQPHGRKLPELWAEKWLVVDEAFEQMVYSLTEQLGKAIGGAIVEFVKEKFPFSPDSSFEL